MHGYEAIVLERELMLLSTNFRFATHHNLQPMTSEKEPRLKLLSGKLRGLLACRRDLHLGRHDQVDDDLPFAFKSEEEKKERIKLLWYRVRVIALANIFIASL